MTIIFERYLVITILKVFVTAALMFFYEFMVGSTRSKFKKWRIEYSRLAYMYMQRGLKNFHQIFYSQSDMH